MLNNEARTPEGPIGAVGSQHRRWEPNARSTESSVETLRLRDGFDLVLSQIVGSECEYHYEEPEDVFGIAFHLRGGANFILQGERFETKPLEVWAGAGPRGSDSRFSLPAKGFRTVSLRFTPGMIRDLLNRHDPEKSLEIGRMALLTTEQVLFARLAALGPDIARIVDAMFNTPFAGPARTLYLESCALGLLAAQIAGDDRSRTPAPDATIERQLLKARDWLDANLETPPSIIELARIVGLNDFRLKRDFKARFGTTIFGYVRQRRMERAAAQLHSGLSVGEAAHLAGYVCPRCFSDAFRRHFGILPSEVTRRAIADSPAYNG